MTASLTEIVLLAHGSKVPEANQAVARLAEEVSRQARCATRCAFLEIAPPDLGTAVADAVSSGAQRIIVIPYFLAMGIHMRDDLPRLVEQQRMRFPGTEIVAGQSLDGHPRMAEVVMDRVREALGNERWQ